MIPRVAPPALMLVLLMFACGERGTLDPASAPASSSTATAPATAPAPPPVPASSRIQGTWRYAPPDGSVGPTIEIEFGPDGMRRSLSGRHEVLVPYSVGEEGVDFVGLDVAAHGGAPAGRHRWRLLEGDRLVHEAAPQVVYVRAPTAELAGDSATTEGSR